MEISKTLLIGAGGAGGLLIQPLARLLQFHRAAMSTLVVADGDAFEAKNAERQLCGPADIGRPKVEVLRELCECQGLSNVETIDDYLDERRFRRAIDNTPTPLVIAAVDNDASRKMTLDVLANRRESGFFWVSAGNADNTAGDSPIRGQAIWWGYDPETETEFGQDPRILYPNLEQPTDDIPRKGSCAANAPSFPQLITANAICAVFCLTVIQNLLDDTLPATSTGAYFDWRNQFRFTFS